MPPRGDVETMILDDEAFESPATSYRGVPFWVWNDTMETDHLTEQVEAIDEAGWGGFFVHPRVGLEVEYLSGEWLEKVRHSVEVADEVGIDPWLYDEDRWPSGSGAGQVPDLGPDYRVKYLALTTERRGDDVLGTVRRNGEEYHACVVIPETEELSISKITNNGYGDLMNPDAVDAFVESTYEVYEGTVGEYFGETIPGIFTDEPQLFRGGEMPGGTVGFLPWTVGLADLFEAEYGYDLREYLAQLFFDADGDDRTYGRVRYDFWRLVTGRFVEAFSERLGEWCRERDLALTGHYLHEDSIPQQIRAVGAVMPHYAHQGQPGIDHLGLNVDNPLTPLQCASVARQFGRPAMSELYGGSGQALSFEERKWIGDWHLARGITVLNHHLSLYSMRGERKRDFPPNIFYQQPWWGDNDHVADYFARLSYALRRGSAVANVLVVHPVQTGWLEYTSAETSDGADAVEALNERFEALVGELSRAHVQFDLGDELLMESHAEATDGALRVGESSYDTVVVPHCRTLQRSTVELLAEFAEGGGDVFAVGEVPSRVDGRPDEDGLAAFRAAAERVDAGSIADLVDRPLRLLDGDDEAGDSVRTHLRETDDGLIAFLANASREEDHRLRLRLERGGRLSRWDPKTGDREAIRTGGDGDETIVDATIPRTGSLLLTLDESADPAAEGGSLVADAPSDRGVDLSETDWRLVREDPNQLVIDRCDLVLDGTEYEDTNVARHWMDVTELHDEAGHVPFEATYEFEVSDDVAGNRMAVVVESADRQRVAFNGAVLPDTDRRWRDVHWHRFDVTDRVEPGTNAITVEGVRDATVEVEAVYVLGDFAVDPDTHRLVPEPDAVTPGDVTDQGYPFYAGELTLETTVEVDEAGTRRLAFDDVHAALASVQVGDGERRDLWSPPWEVPVSLAPGRNRVAVTLVTSLRNLTGPHHAEQEFHAHSRESNFVSPATFRHPDNLGSVSVRAGADEWTEEYHVVPVGVDGPRLTQ
jgi:hypothetical protein